MSIASMSVPQLLEQRTLIDTQICLKTGGAVAGLTVGKKLNELLFDTFAGVGAHDVDISKLCRKQRWHNRVW